MEIEGTDAGEWIQGTAADDVINAGGGDDEIYAPEGNNTIDGGAGMDSFIVYEGVRNDYTLTSDADGSCVIEGPGLNGVITRNVLTNVEKVVFNDGWILIDSVKTDDGGDDTDEEVEDDDPSVSDASNKTGSNKSDKDDSGKSGSNKSDKDDSGKSGSNKSDKDDSGKSENDPNQPPVVPPADDLIAVKDIAFTTDGQPVWGNVLDNDLGLNGEISVELKSSPEHGYVLLNEDGSFDYVPQDGFVGHDVFQYTVRDTNGNMSMGDVCIFIEEGNTPVPPTDPTPPTDPVDETDHDDEPSGSNKSAKDDSGKSGSNKSAKDDSGKSGSNKSAKDDSGKSGSNKSAKDDSGKSGSNKSAKDDSGKSGSNKSAKDDSGKSGSNKSAKASGKKMK